MFLDVDDEKEVDENEGSIGNLEYYSIVWEFWVFFSDCKDVFDEVIIVKLFGR